MIEQKIDELITALNANTAALQGNAQTAAPAASPAPSQTAAPAPAAAPAAPYPPAGAAQPAAPAPTNFTPPISKEELLGELRGVIQHMNDQGAAVQQLLTGTFGVQKVSDLDPNRYVEVRDAARRLVQG